MAPPPPAGPPPRAASLTAYVSRTCGACMKFVNLLANNPRLLAATDIKILDDDPAAVLEMHDANVFATPALKIVGADGSVQVFSGPAAVNALIQLA